MKNPTSIELPKTVDEFRDAIKIAIEEFQNSPVKNNNKLNHSLAKSLKFTEYRALQNLLTNKSNKQSTIKVEILGNDTFINRIKIDDKAQSEELTEYYLVNKQEYISNLHMWIKDRLNDFKNNYPHKESEIPDMKRKLQELNEIDDIYFFESYNNGNDWIAASIEPEHFNEICLEILEEHSKLIKKTYTLDDMQRIFGKHLETNVYLDDDCFRCKNCGSEWSVCMSEDQIPEVCDHCCEDVRIVDVCNLSVEEQSYYNNNYGIHLKNSDPICFETIFLAKDFQRQYRKLIGLDVDTGERI